MNVTTAPASFRTALLIEPNPPSGKDFPPMSTLAFESPSSPALSLRPYQEQALEAIDVAESRGVRRQLVVLPTGSGKTCVFSSLVSRRSGRALVLAHRDELITQAVQKLAMIGGTLDIGVVKAQRDERDAAVIVASMQTLANPKRLARLPKFSTVIIDECFPAGTMIGSQSIEAVRAGDLVPSWDPVTGCVAERPVAAVMSRRPAAMVRVTFEDGTSLACTPSHPLMTDAGWCPASRLPRGVSVLAFTHDAVDRTNNVFPLWRDDNAGGLSARQLAANGTGVLRPGLRTGDAAGSWRGAASAHDNMCRVRAAGHTHGEAQALRLAAVGQGVLLGHLPGPLGQSRQFHQGLTDQPSARLAAHAGKQPNGARRGAGKDDRNTEANRAPATGTWRQRVGTDRAPEATIRVSRVADRGHGTRTRWADAAQVRGGHRAPVDDGVRRGGRGVPLLAGPPRVGPAQGRTARGARVADVQILEPGRDGTYGGVCPDGLVYNLEVEGTHTYLVGPGVVAHNCHHSVSRTYLEIIEGLGCFRKDGPLTVGFTATAGRSDKIGLGAAWEEITFQRGIVQMIAEGYLCDVKAMEIGSDIDLGRVTTSAGDFTDESLGAELERAEVLDAAAKALRQHAPDRPTVAFTPTIATAHILAGKLREQGFRAEAVSGETHIDERRAILKRLHSGETQVVSNAQVLVEGFDEPKVSCILLCRPTKSAPAFCQMIGRSLRPFMGKENALLLDMVGASDLGLATIADLAGLPPRTVKPGQSLMEASDEQATITKRKAVVAASRTRHVELLRRSDLRWLPAEDGWVLPAGPDQAMIIVPADDELWDVWRSPKHGAPILESGKPLTLDWARGVGEEVARAQGGILALAGAPWRKRPPSDAQLAALRRIAKPDQLQDITRGGAADLMTAHYAGKDIRRLRKLRSAA